MRSDISIQGIAPVSTTGDPAPEAKEAATGGTAKAGSVAAAPIYANPALRLEPALGLVVIEFRDSSGALTNSFPSQRQLQAYKMHALGSPAKSGMTDPYPASTDPASTDLGSRSAKMSPTGSQDVTPAHATGSAAQRPGVLASLVGPDEITP